MEITSVESIPLRADLPGNQRFGSSRLSFDQRTGVLARVETADGLVGWGDAGIAPPETTATMVDEAIADVVVGTDPFDVRNLASSMYAENYVLAGQGVYQMALSGVETAVWDVLGKATGQPVSSLLGGTCRDHVTPYATTMFFREMARKPADPIEDAVDEEYVAAKIKIGRGLEDDIERVRAARSALGDEGYLMVDINGNYRPKRVIQLANEIKQYDITWIEEPVPPEDHAGYREIRNQIDIPLSGGEMLNSRFAFKELIDERLVDVAQPDLCKVGGLAEAKNIVDMGMSENLAVVPHVWTTGVGVAANLQLAATIPTYPTSLYTLDPLFFESDRIENPFRDELVDRSFTPSDGTLPIPDEPGLGVTPREDVIERYRVD